MSDQNLTQPTSSLEGDDLVEAAVQKTAASIKPNPHFIERLSARLRARHRSAVPRRARLPLWGWLSAALVLVLTIGVAGRALLPGISTPATPDVTTLAQPPSDSTPEPAPDWLADLPPALAEVFPRPGQEVSAESAAITLRFGAPMDRASVEQAVHVTPAVEGEFVWDDDQTVTFRPKSLAVAADYRVLVDTSARGSNGLPLSRELAFNFSTLSPLQVTHVSPANNSRDLRGDSPLLLAFNYPVVPINCTGQVADAVAGCAPLDLTFTPGMVGQGFWVNTSLYRYDPLPAWDTGVTYTATLAAGLTSVDGAILDTPMLWNFSTAAPRLLSYLPSEPDTLLEAVVQLGFNTPMNSQSVQDAFTLTDPDGNRVTFTAAWSDNNTRVVLTPTQQLVLGTRYAARLEATALAVNGSAVGDASAWYFTTVPAPVIKSVGVQGNRLDLYSGLEVAFAGLMDPATFEGRLRLLQGRQIVNFNTWFSDYDNKLYIHWDKEPSTEYCLTIEPGIADRYGNTIAVGRTDCFTSAPREPFFLLAARGDMLTLDAAEPSRLYFVAANVGEVRLTLSTMGENSMLAYQFSPTQRVRQWTLTPDTPRDAVTLLPVDLLETSTLAPGYYLLEWTVPGAQRHMGAQRARIVVVDRHVTLKVAQEEALVWVTDLRTGQPVSGAEVRLLVDEAGNLLGSGVTDADGIARFDIRQSTNRWANMLAVTGVAGQPGFGVAHNEWNAGVSAWDFGIDAAYYTDFIRPRIYLQTDRPIYRPGQLVHARGIARLDNDAAYTLLPAGQEITLVLHDPNWEQVSQLVVELNEQGTFAVDFDLGDEALLGYYTLQARTLGTSEYDTWSVTFAVAAYRKPEFEVSVTSEHDARLQGETLRALVEGAYYSGGAVHQARVAWTVRAEPYSFWPDVPGWWSWNTSAGWWGYEPEIIAQGEGQTDVQGRFWVELPATLETLRNDESIVSQRWTIEATITDESGFPVTGRSEVVIHAARFYLGLRPDSWVAESGKVAAINVLALDWDEAPVAAQPLVVSLVKRAWRMVPATQPFNSPTWVFSDTLISELPLTTDAQGKAVARVTPPTSGYYVVIAESADDGGNLVRTETGLWVSGPQAAAWRTEEGKITPVADARSYRSGDTARILLPTPFSGAYQVLLTIERGGILEAQRLTFTEPNPLIEIPITEVHVPNIIVSFVVVKGVDANHRAPDVRIGMVNLEVEPVRQALTVEIIPDRNTPYLPGDRVSLTIRATDYAGRPVAAELALAVVDKAVLALADPNSPPLLDAFYSPRGLGVRTGDSNLVLFNRTSANLEELEEQAERIALEAMMGGIGGGGGGDAMLVDDVRQDFPDTAYWEAHLQTDTSGVAQVTFDLPDSLTTWVVDARAVTANTQVGETTAEFVVSKPLLVRPVTPRFFTAGDRAEVATVVHNNTDAPINTTVRLEALGVTLESAPEQTVTLPAHGRARVTWTLVVPLGESDATLLTFRAEGGGYSDAARPSVGRESDRALPIYRYETPDVLGTLGTLLTAGSRLEAAVIPPDAGPESALTVRIEPTLAAAMTESLSYLEHFEHECTEQLVSRFLPNVMTYRALQTLGIDNHELRAELELQLEYAVRRLRARQGVDGGWGWWRRDRSDFQTSAYAVLGLLQAQRAGFEVETVVLQRGAEYVQRTLERELRLQGTTQNPQRTLPQAFALYVLAEADVAWPEGADVALYEDRHQLDVAGRAYLALALGVRDSGDPRVVTLLEGLRADAEITASGAQWDGGEAVYWSSRTRATAVTLAALARLAPDDPLMPQAVRWLMTARRAARWETTQDTAWSVIALNDYMLATGELQADYTWGVGLNGAQLGEGQLTEANRRSPVEFTVPVGELLRDWPNALEIYRSEGQGALYYTADLRIYRPVDTVTAESRGIMIQREYCAVQTTPTQTPWGADFETCIPITSARPGELVEVRLTLILPRTRNFLVVEDYYPAGMEPVDSTLKTEVDVPDGEVVRPSQRFAWWWMPTFDHQELRDERAVFYAQQLGAGTYQVRYFLRGAIPGEYRVLPATASEMYFPEVWGRTDGVIFRVEP